MANTFIVLLAFSPMIIILGSVFITSIKNNIPKEKVNNYPTITFEEFLRHYNDAPQKWDCNNFKYDDSIYLKYETERVYFTSPREEKKFVNWYQMKEDARESETARKKLEKLQSKWAADAVKNNKNELSSLQTQYDEMAAAVQYWQDVYNEIMKGQK